MSQPAPASLPVVEGTGDTVRLPANAYMALAPGEAYQPIVPAASAPPEATRRSVVWGVSLCIVFTVASAYSGLKVGQVIGETDTRAEKSRSGHISFQNIVATLYHVLGIHPRATLPDFNGRPQYLLDNSQPVRELVG